MHEDHRRLPERAQRKRQSILGDHHDHHSGRPRAVASGAGRQRISHRRRHLERTRACDACNQRGCAQQLVKLPAAQGIPTGGLRVTIARFFSPRGVCYTGRGVLPDIIADRFKPEEMDRDNQLAEAIADLRRQVAMR